MRASWILGPLALFMFLCVSPVTAQETSDTFDGKSKFLVTGYGYTTFANPEHEPTNFQVGFNPIILWKPGRNFLFESEFEYSTGGEGSLEVEYAQQLYFAHDYITLGVGKFLSPINYFMERLHPAWINKLPSAPLGIGGHGTPLLAPTQIGFQVRGAFPTTLGRLTATVYGSNGPSLTTGEEEEGGEDGGHGHGSGAAGTLNFGNLSDQNDGKAVGGRVALVLRPGFELGYGIESASVGDPNSEFEDVRSLNNVVDLSLVRDLAFAKGRIDIRGQHVWLEVDNPDTHPLEFENKSTAGYLQAAFRPTAVSSDHLKRLEAVVRYDRVKLPEEGPLNLDQERVTAGLNYWASPSTVVKLAYESLWDAGEPGSDYTLMAQAAMGF